MDEATLEASIAAYSAQLQQVEAVLSAGTDPSQQPDLLQLKEDLHQLIELTEASLVSVKKSQLLASLESGDGLGVVAAAGAAPSAGTATGGLDTEFSAFYSELGGAVSGNDSGAVKSHGGREAGGTNGEEEDEQEEEEEDNMSGTKVRAPYRTSWGTLEYHNAMVVGTEPPDGDEPQVRVLYIYPTQKSMKPCPYFLEDKCRFLDNCRFSHGEVVNMLELRDFLELDLTSLQDGSACLARHEDGIWYPARITEIDNGFYTVKFDSLLLKDAVLEADGIIPPLREDDHDSSNSDDSADEDVAYAKVIDSTVEESGATLSTSHFGGWEAHTRGIGSKLMLKMGYEYGKGLGKKQEGRVEPVTAVVLPKGQSLDMCGELTQRRTQSRTAKDSDATAHKARKRKPRARTTGGRSTVFDFLNQKLGDGGRESGSSRAPCPAPSRAGVEAYQGGKSMKRSLNVKLFKAAEKVSQTEREIKGLMEALSKRAGRDASMVTHLEEKLCAARSLLAQQKAHETSIQIEHKKADTHKKMTF